MLILSKTLHRCRFQVMVIWKNACRTSNYRYTNFENLPQASIWDFLNVPLTSPGIIPRIHSIPLRFGFWNIRIVPSRDFLFSVLFLFKTWNLYHFLYLYVAVKWKLRYLFNYYIQTRFNLHTFDSDQIRNVRDFLRSA